MPVIGVLSTKNTTRRHVSCTLSGGKNHSKTPENTDPPFSDDQNIYLLTRLKKYVFLYVYMLVILL
jgi:hypothetical protein